MTDYERILAGCLHNAKLDPTEADLSAGVAKLLANPTEALRAFKWKDHAELGRLLAHETNNAIFARAEKEARELAASMGVTA